MCWCRQAGRQAARQAGRQAGRKARAWAKQVCSAVCRALSGAAPVRRVRPRPGPQQVPHATAFHAWRRSCLRPRHVPPVKAHPAGRACAAPARRQTLRMPPKKQTPTHTHPHAPQLTRGTLKSTFSPTLKFRMLPVLGSATNTTVSASTPCWGSRQGRWGGGSQAWCLSGAQHRRRWQLPSKGCAHSAALGAAQGASCCTQASTHKRACAALSTREGSAPQAPPSNPPGAAPQAHPVVLDGKARRLQTSRRRTSLEPIGALRQGAPPGRLGVDLHASWMQLRPPPLPSTTALHQDHHRRQQQASPT